MTNRFSPVLTRTTRVCETSFNLCSEEYLELSEDFAGALLALEQRHSDELLPSQVQETVSTSDVDFFESHALQPCYYDAAGLKVGLEIDVRWI